MIKWLVGISKQKLIELEKKVNKLDPENVSARLNKAVEEIEKFKKETREELKKAVETQATNISTELRKTLEKTVQERITSFSDSLGGIVRKKGEEQDEKIEKFISSIQKTVKIIWSQISDAIKSALGPILAEKPGRAAEPEKGKREGEKG